MPRKKKDPPTPIDTAKKKPPKKKSPILDAAITGKSLSNIVIPEKLLKRSTPRALANGNFQRALLAFFIPHLSTPLLNSLVNNLGSSDVPTQRLTAEMMGLTPKSPGVSISMNQNNANVSRSSGKEEGGVRSFEDIIRSLSERKSRPLESSPHILELEAEHKFVPTPED